MSKELKKELFNIYDIVVFKDENGITQDCVCIIGSNKEVDEIVDMVECNNHSISIYENGSYTVWEKDGEDMPYYETNKKIIHLYTLKNDNRFYEIYPTNDYEAIDNANPSEALECLENIEADLTGLPKHVTEYDDGFDNYLEDIWGNVDTIKQALLKAQEPKHYLKWEDLKNSNLEEHLKVKLNNVKYELHFEKWARYDDATRISLYLNEFCVMSIRLKTNYEKQFFNDLHLERVEE